MRLLVLVVASLSLLACETRTIPRIDSGPPPPDSGPPPVPDAGRDAGPPVDGGPRLDDVLIYAHSRDTLFTFSPYTNTVTEIGGFRLPDGTEAPFMLDLAVDAAGVIYTSSDAALFRVDPRTATATQIGTFGLGRDEQLFALSFLAPSESPDGTEMLVGATNAGVYYEVDRDDASTSPLGAYPDGWGSSGDIVSVDGLGTFATLRRSDFPSDVLARILFARDGSSIVTVIGPVESASEGFRQIFGLGYWGREFFGFTNAGQLIRIDRTNGDATIVSTETGASQFWGAGVTVDVPFLE